jgi:hypothetical protein
VLFADHGGKLSVVSLELGTLGSSPSGSPASGSTRTAAFASTGTAAAVGAGGEGTAAAVAAGGDDASSVAVPAESDKSTEAVAEAAGCVEPATDACPENRLDCSNSLEKELQRLRLAAQNNDSILQQLAAKYGCDDGSPKQRWVPAACSASGSAGSLATSVQLQAHLSKAHWAHAI